MMNARHFIKNLVRKFKRQERRGELLRRTRWVRWSQLTVLAVWGLYTAWGGGWGLAYLIATLQRLAPSIHALLLRLGL